MPGPRHPARRLPGSVQQLADVIGEDCALRLVNGLPRSYSKGHPGGQPMLYVPKTLPVDHALCRLIGYQAAHRLVCAFGGEFLYPASCASLARAERDQVIADRLASGDSVTAIAADVGLSERQVRNVRREIAPVPETGDSPEHDGQIRIGALA